MELTLAGGIRSVGRDTWTSLAPAGNPFLAYAFLDAMEASGSAAAKAGWQPLHLVAREHGAAVAAAPLYVKGHSWGEYVFDHSWADALTRTGQRYYPKLQVAVPFTPVPGPRLLARDPAARAALAQGLRASLAQLELSSLHVTFCADGEVPVLEEAGFLIRRGIQYHWQNPGCRDFADFLDQLKSSKRKMVRKEREQVRASGIEVAVLQGAGDAARVLEEFYPFYVATVDKRWGSAYLTPDFFRRLARTMADRVVLVTARAQGELVAAALNIQGDDTLYGRLWGCLDEYKFLHFECCYYQAIEHAIRNRLARVEAGAQGTHKLHRGYAPVWTWSAHLLRDPGLHEGVRRFLEAETREMRERMAELEGMVPYRQTGGGCPS